MKQAILNELKHEAANTRKMLERVPFDKATWRPHEKSTTLQGLAQHIANLPIWIKRITTADEFNFANGFTPPPTVNSIEELLTLQAERIQEATQALENLPEEDFVKPFTLRKDDQIFLTLPKAAVIRNVVLNHLVHHRGQLSVYLRQLDVPIPGMYGPSADEKKAFSQAGT